MRKLALISLLALAGCIEEGEDMIQRDRTITVCLDGVAYWLTNADTQSQMLAPRISPETLDFVRCK